jgi:3-oxoacyl-(acyl-carrier-protein) synthase
VEIFVTGLGIISSIGNNVEECLQSFENHQSGIGKIKFLKTRNKDLFLVGEVKKDNEELAEMNQIVEDSVSRIDTSCSFCHQRGDTGIAFRFFKQI